MSAGLRSPESRIQSEAESAHTADLALTGLATRLCSPALMHAIRGHLHNLALLSELLQKETAAAVDVETIRGSTHARTTSIRAEVETLHRQLRVIEDLAGPQDGPDTAICDVCRCVDEVLTAARVEAARRRVQIRLDLKPDASPVICQPSAFKPLILTCAIYTIRRCRNGDSVVIAVEERDGGTTFEFSGGPLAEPSDEIDRALELELLAKLAAMAGARFVAQPRTYVTFRTAMH